MSFEEELGTLLFEMTLGDDDNTPLQMISTSRLDYYRRLDAAVKALALVLHSEPSEA